MYDLKITGGTIGYRTGAPRYVGVAVAGAAKREILAGKVTRKEDHDTSARPGRLVNGAR